MKLHHEQCYHRKFKPQNDYVVTSALRHYQGGLRQALRFTVARSSEEKLLEENQHLRLERVRIQEDIVRREKQLKEKEAQLLHETSQMKRSVRGLETSWNCIRRDRMKLLVG